MWNDTATGCQWAMQTCWQFSELAVTDCSFQFVFSSQFPSCSVVGCLRSSLSVAAGQAGPHSAAGWPSVSAGPPGSQAGGRWCWTRWESSPPPTRSGRAQPGPCWSERGSAAGRRPVTERERESVLGWQLVVSPDLRSLDLDVTAGCQSAGQLTGSAGPAHLVDGHVRSPLSLLGDDLEKWGQRLVVTGGLGCVTWMVCCPLAAVPLTGTTRAGRVLPLGLTERICCPCC